MDPFASARLGSNSRSCDNLPHVFKVLPVIDLGQDIR